MGQNQPPQRENTGQTAPPGTLNSGAAAPWTSAPGPEHLQQINKAKLLGKKVRRAQSVANFSACTTAIFATITIVCSLTSIWGLILGGSMAAISIIEFRGAGELKRLDLTAPRRLALNQLAFGALLFLYGAISLWQSLHDPSGAMSQMTKELGGTDGLSGMESVQSIESISKLVIIALYGGVMLAAIGPVLTAVYYNSRKRYIEEYLSQTPKWILDLQRAGMSI